LASSPPPPRTPCISLSQIGLHYKVEPVQLGNPPNSIHPPSTSPRGTGRAGTARKWQSLTLSHPERQREAAPADLLKLR
jgi:hypothetical protein